MEGKSSIFFARFAKPSWFARALRKSGLSLRALHCNSVSLFLALSGCCSLGSNGKLPEVPLAIALDVVQQDLLAAKPIILADIATAEGRANLSDALVEAQCADKSSNALMTVITGASNIQLQGSITDAKGLTGTVSATPSLALAYTVTLGRQQQLTIPITFVSLRTLSSFYLGQGLANLNGLSDAQKAPFVAALLQNKKDLDDVVNDVIKKYPPPKCPDQPKKHPINPYIFQIQ